MMKLESRNRLYIDNAIPKDSDEINELEIDVSVQINSSDLYEYTFNQMYNTVKQNKEYCIKACKYMKEVQRPILYILDNETELYDRIVSLSCYSMNAKRERMSALLNGSTE